jgi:hypothetical protein
MSKKATESNFTVLINLKYLNVVWQCGTTKGSKTKGHEVEVPQETFGSAQILMVWWSDITLQCV